MGVVAVMLNYGQGYYDDGYELHAVFPSSSQGLFTDGGSDVKVRGLNVGTVAAIELLDDGRARLTLFIDEGVEIPDTASASIEPLSIFGPKFVDIAPGAHEAGGPFLAPGDRIVETHTSVELTHTLDSAVRLLSAIDPRELLAVFDAVAEGVDGMGPQIGRTIDSSGVLAGVAAAHGADASLFLTDVAALSGTIAEHADDILATVGDLGHLLPALNERPDRINQLLDVTTEISTTFSRLIGENRAELDAVIEAMAAFVGGVYSESENIPEILDLAGTFFGRLSDVIRMPGPAGTELAALRGFVSLDVCLILDVCAGGLPALGLADLLSPTGDGP